MEVKGELFKFSSPFPTFIQFYLGLFNLIWRYLRLFGPNKLKQSQTRGTCAQAHEKELLECGTQLSVQLPAFLEGLPSRDQVGR